MWSQLKTFNFCSFASVQYSFLKHHFEVCSNEPILVCFSLSSTTNGEKNMLAYDIYVRTTSIESQSLGDYHVSVTL